MDVDIKWEGRVIVDSAPYSTQNRADAVGPLPLTLTKDEQYRLFTPLKYIRTHEDITADLQRAQYKMQHNLQTQGLHKTSKGDDGDINEDEEEDDVVNFEEEQRRREEAEMQAMSEASHSVRGDENSFNGSNEDDMSQGFDDKSADTSMSRSRAGGSQVGFDLPPLGVENSNPSFVASQDFLPVPTLKTSARIKFLSYHVLADCKAVQQRHTTTKNWEYRSQMLLQEIKSYDADIICLQDVDHFNDFWRSKLMLLGYDNVFKQRTQKRDSHTEGVVIAYKRELFQLFKTVSVELNNAADMDTEKGGTFREKCKTDDVGLILFLQPWPAGYLQSALCVCSACFADRESQNDVRIVQSMYLARQIELANKEFHVPVILGVSLYDEPDASSYHILRTGRTQLKENTPGKMKPPTCKAESRGSVRLYFYCPTMSPSDPKVIKFKIAWRPGGSRTLGFRAQKEVLFDDCRQYAPKKNAKGVRYMAPIDELTAIVTGLSSDLPYEFRMVACNIVGDGTWSEPSLPIVMPNPEKMPPMPSLVYLRNMVQVREIREVSDMERDDWDVEAAVQSNPINSLTQLTPRDMQGRRSMELPRSRALPLSTNPREGWKEKYGGGMTPALKKEVTSAQFLKVHNMIRDEHGKYNVQVSDTLDSRVAIMPEDVAEEYEVESTVSLNANSHFSLLNHSYSDEVAQAPNQDLFYQTITDSYVVTNTGHIQMTDGLVTPANTLDVSHSGMSVIVESGSTLTIEAAKDIVGEGEGQAGAVIDAEEQKQSILNGDSLESGRKSGRKNEEGDIGDNDFDKRKQGNEEEVGTREEGADGGGGGEGGRGSRKGSKKEGSGEGFGYDGSDRGNDNGANVQNELGEVDDIPYGGDHKADVNDENQITSAPAFDEMSAAAMSALTNALDDHTAGGGTNQNEHREDMDDNRSYNSISTMETAQRLLQSEKQNALDDEGNYDGMFDGNFFDDKRGPTPMSRGIAFTPFDASKLSFASTSKFSSVQLADGGVVPKLLSKDLKELLNDDAGLDTHDVMKTIGRPNYRQVHSLNLRSAYEAYSSGGEPVYTAAVPTDGTSTSTKGVRCIDYIFYSGDSMRARRVLSIPPLAQLVGEDPRQALTIGDPYWLKPVPSALHMFNSHKKVLGKVYPLNPNNINAMKHKVSETKKLLETILKPTRPPSSQVYASGTEAGTGSRASSPAAKSRANTPGKGRGGGHFENFSCICGD